MEMEMEIKEIEKQINFLSIQVDALINLKKRLNEYLDKEIDGTNEILMPLIHQKQTNKFDELNKEIINRTNKYIYD